MIASKARQTMNRSAIVSHLIMSALAEAVMSADHSARLMRDSGDRIQINVNKLSMAVSACAVLGSGVGSGTVGL